MPDASELRLLRPADCASVRDLLGAAFPSAAEADLVEALRRDGDMLVELVHEGPGGVDGHVAASAMRAPLDPRHRGDDGAKSGDADQTRRALISVGMRPLFARGVVAAAREGAEHVAEHPLDHVAAARSAAVAPIDQAHRSAAG